MAARPVPRSGIARALPLLAAVTATMPALAGAEFTLRSADVEPEGNLRDQHVYSGFGCSGGNVSPQLSWREVPGGTRSFVITMFDPDAPTGSGWWHWVVYDIPANVTELPRGAGSGKAPLPKDAKQGRTDFGAPGYGGPCPPPGKPHRYVFTIFALKVDRLGLPSDASPAVIGATARAGALGSASLTAHYGRNK